MNKEQLVKELKTYFSERTDTDKESDFRKLFEVIDALETLKKISKSEWGMLYDAIFKATDLVIETIVDYSLYPAQSEE